MVPARSSQGAIPGPVGVIGAGLRLVYRMGQIRMIMGERQKSVRGARVEAVA